MRSGSRFSVGSRVCLAGLVFLAIGVEARADVMRHNITYSTSIESPSGGAWDLPGIKFQGVENQSVRSATPFDGSGGFPLALVDGDTAAFPLGRLLLDIPPEGVQPGGGEFGITVRVDAIDGVQLADPLTMLLRGDISIRANGTSVLNYASMDPLAMPPGGPPSSRMGGSFEYGGINHYLALYHVPFGEQPLAPNNEIPLSVDLMSVSVVNTPEPSTWAIFSIAALGAWCSHRRRLGKQANRRSVA